MFVVIKSWLQSTWMQKNRYVWYSLKYVSNSPWWSSSWGTTQFIMWPYYHSPLIDPTKLLVLIHIKNSSVSRTPNLSSLLGKFSTSFIASVAIYTTGLTVSQKIRWDRNRTTPLVLKSGYFGQSWSIIMADDALVVIRSSVTLVLTMQHKQGADSIYRKTSNIIRTLVDNENVDHSDVVGASPVGAAPTTSSFST